MVDKPGIVITGASGRMGQMLIRTVLDSDKARLVGVVERSGHAWVGQDVGVMMGGAAVGVSVTDDPLGAFTKAQAVIDFTAPEATLQFARLAAQARVVHVIGTRAVKTYQDCRAGQIVVTTVAKKLTGGCQLYDPVRLRDSGSLMLTPEGKLVSAQDLAGQRLWTGTVAPLRRGAGP